MQLFSSNKTPIKKEKVFSHNRTNITIDKSKLKTINRLARDSTQIRITTISIISNSSGKSQTHLLRTNFSIMEDVNLDWLVAGGNLYLRLELMTTNNVKVGDLTPVDQFSNTFLLKA